MSPFFLVLLLTVAASLLLSLAAVARTVWLRLRPAGAAQLGIEQSLRYSNASDSLLLLAVGLSCYSVAAGWAGQLVCYPIYADMSAYGPQAFHAYSHGSLSRCSTLNPQSRATPPAVADLILVSPIPQNLLMIRRSFLKKLVALPLVAATSTVPRQPSLN